jgi:hypothetical protein
MLGFQPYFDIQHNQDCRVVSYRLPAALYQQGDYLVHISVLEAEWTPGLLNAVRKNTSLQMSQLSYRESNSETPVLWSSASLDCIYRLDLLYDDKI